MIRFLHTADVQLGMGFGPFSADRRPLLQRARFECLGALLESVARAGYEAPEFILIAGDFFDSPTLGDESVIEACARVRALQIPTYVLPGNHDFVESGLFRRASFKDHAPPNLHVLDTGTPVLAAEGRAVILPAPLRYRRSADDATSHWSGSLGRDLAPNSVRIGIAHGAVIDFAGRDAGGDRLNIVDPARAREAELDYLALGDWHGQLQIDTRTWYSGAPEATSFRDNLQGRALLVEIDGTGSTPRVLSVPTGRYTWIQRELTVHHADHVSALEGWFDSLPRRFETVLWLDIRGTLPILETTRLHQLLERIRAEVGVARIETTDLAMRVGDDDLDVIAIDGYVRTAIERLRKRSVEDGTLRDIAERALALLYNFRQSEVR